MICDARSSVCPHTDACDWAITPSDVSATRLALGSPTVLQRPPATSNQTSRAPAWDRLGYDPVAKIKPIRYDAAIHDLPGYSASKQRITAADAHRHPSQLELIHEDPTVSTPRPIHSQVRSPWIRYTLMALLLIGIWFYRDYVDSNDRSEPAGTSSPSISAPDNGAISYSNVGERAILDAFDNRQSNVQAEFTATVVKNLPDDNEGSRHQKMILALPSGHTVLLAHNIDLADRVPARPGDRIEVSGEYEFSEMGGVIHWTHHDPSGRHPDGWIRHDGQTYQ
ncbi:MAG: DUF3465 domain-containing protein [Planctomycetales bacterium]|nr:DUF3465 domain-containing protein [Planctomycetales bacterium]